MNKNIRALATFLVICYVALFVRLNMLSVYQADSLNEKPGNTRRLQEAFNTERGDIVSADGKLVATSEETDGFLKYQRSYPQGDLFSHVAGSYTYLFGSNGVEQTYDDELRGDTSKFTLDDILSPFADDANVGTVNLTVRHDLQQLAKDSLGDLEGSVVALDPQTGAILAMYSNPSYDTNLVVSNDSDTAEKWRDALNENESKPILARAYQDIYFPGSTFKLVTAAAGLESGTVSEVSPVYPRSAGYQPPLTNSTIRNFGGSTCGGALVAILRVSCNSAFAEMAAETIGPEAMISEAEDFGFNQDVPIDLPAPVRSIFPTDYGEVLRAGNDRGDADVYEDTPALALSGIGQGNVSATPLQMALVASGIANNGKIMVPHVMETITNRNGDEVDTYADEVWRHAMTSENADVLRRAMIDVAEDGTARRLQIDGLVVGGKTGTAQLGVTPPQSHAWIVAFGGEPNRVPDIAVAVLVKAQPGASEQTGGRVAAPIAKDLIEAGVNVAKFKRGASNGD